MNTRPDPTGRARRVHVRGFITSAGFAEGHRFVVGCWPDSPVGPICDVMWATPENERILLVPSDVAGEFITSIYQFDAVRTGPLHVECDGRRTTVRGHKLALDLVGGRRRPIPIRRPLAITRHVEAPIARLLMGVETYGISPTGAREWYQSRGWRWVTRGTAALDGRDLGPPGPLAAPVGVGFSEPPHRPSIVSVRVTIEPPTTPLPLPQRMAQRLDRA